MELPVDNEQLAGKQWSKFQHDLRIRLDAKHKNRQLRWWWPWRWGV